METVRCNLCGSARYSMAYEMPDRHYFPNEFFTVVACDECGLGFVNPRPSFEEIQRYYPPAYFEELSRNHKSNLRRYAAQAEYLREIEKRHGPKNLLDVGCANGDFPRFMIARGWNVEGVEISASARPIPDFKVYIKQFPDIPVNDPTYDAVTAWAVLEHLHDPMSYFKKASRIIKEDGLFVFLVHNFESIASRYLFCEDVPRHLYFFTEKTVRRYLKKTGFRLTRVDYGGSIFPITPANWLPFLIKTKIKRKQFTYGDLPSSKTEFWKRNNLKPGALSTLQFLIREPEAGLIWAVERALLPLVTAVQTFRRTHMTCTYVATKSGR